MAMDIRCGQSAKEGMLYQYLCVAKYISPLLYADFIYSYFFDSCDAGYSRSTALSVVWLSLSLLCAWRGFRSCRAICSDWWAS